MPRARSLKPGFFKNELLAQMPPHARLLFAGLWTLADRAGRLEDRPKRIKAEVFPYENVNVDRLLQSLHESPERFIVRYSIGDDRYIQVSNWDKHQNPHVREPESAIPAPCKAPDKHCAGTVPSTSLALLTPDSLFPDSGLRTSEREITAPVLVAQAGALALDDGFAEFRSIAEQSGMHASEPDWIEAQKFEWRKLDFEQRLAAVDGLRNRVGTGDFTLAALPRNYLAKQMWQRPIRAQTPQSKPPGPKASVLDYLEEGISER